MDRIGRIALSVTCGAVAVAGVIVVASHPGSEAPVSLTPAEIVQETQSPEFESPAPPKPRSYADGDYVIGDDIPFGTYVSGGAKDDVFDLCMVSSTGEGHWPILKTANANERLIVRITKKNTGDILSVSGCKALERRS